MISNVDSSAKYNIRVNCKLEELIKEISDACYINMKSYYMINIYMIPEIVDILKITDLSSLESYVIIQDLNGLEKQIIHKNGNVIKSSTINDILAVKELLLKLNYNELMYMNYDIYCYQKNNSFITIKNILKQGIFIEGNEEMLSLLKEKNIPYDSSNLCVDNEKNALENVQKNLKNNMK
ncbi:MAG: hypothetical protein Q4D02_04085 [Clostridia bacterium]|nr:hypothetical protein [Clostridia bacterium]